LERLYGEVRRLDLFVRRPRPSTIMPPPRHLLIPLLDLAELADLDPPRGFGRD
jgi:hypothetical protein